ncbi:MULTISPECIES: hypothetical protein [unclassified Paenibacillus]|uniref:Uncharacterized protein n=1 Tax=Paenibacillus provencensis TaxID=441151 RepID=A0ABW3PVC2_9BACL|nr:MULTISPECIES: hypothetical protein [unclassified Paenibacillus]MCM3130156.1 hypothetical protein [Paenibacillus sp. MER 78]SDX70690.1 hypothetical protein SAMN05518848_11244 [Paenibacillus sp. PDC88]SFS88241.1 hypothetical protein SAMN04488601_10640 [Paenibacillus sp. 453mf]
MKSCYEFELRKLIITYGIEFVSYMVEKLWNTPQNEQPSLKQLVGAE